MEPIDPYAPEPLVPEITQVIMVDASHASKKIDMSSMASYIASFGQMPTKSYSKRMATIECSTYRAELVTARIGVEAALAMRNKARMLELK
ncbi:expressed unknown protein [Seminavis robusta]|uniref:Uncharacterized protein n=1 Tax=Seminavis robusta TaxID=568900 RepID=A0A9N8ERT4_9STRA|nr:expressed unknown protein [Seminavis robusta]|eukprot:Sro1602_g285230.1 n/a (91) ;mRNA; f:1024-1296